MCIFFQGQNFSGTSRQKIFCTTGGGASRPPPPPAHSIPCPPPPGTVSPGNYHPPLRWAICQLPFIQRTRPQIPIQPWNQILFFPEKVYFQYIFCRFVGKMTFEDLLGRKHSFGHFSKPQRKFRRPPPSPKQGPPRLDTLPLGEGFRAW